MKNRFLTLLFISIILFTAFIPASDFPEPIGYVNDFEKIFTPEEVKELNEIIEKYEKETTNQIAVVTTASIAPYTSMADYAKDLANAWGVGKYNQNNGLTIVVSKQLREARICTGLRTEKKLPDAVCKNVMDSIMIPEFKKGNYYSGVKKGLLKLMKQW